MVYINNVIILILALLGNSFLIHGYPLDDESLYLTKDEAQYLKDDPVLTHKVIFDITQDSKPLGSIKFGLFGNTVPKTVENFITIAQKSSGQGYKDCRIHRIIENYVIQSGDIENGNGTGGFSVFNEQLFEDENFTIKHNKKGRLSMTNNGKNRNGSQFFISLLHDAHHLDEKYVSFGQVINGFDTVQAINVVPLDDNNVPKLDIVISEVRVIKMKFKNKNIQIYEGDKEGENDQTINNGDLVFEEFIPFQNWILLGFAVTIIFLVIVRRITVGNTKDKFHHSKRLPE